MFAPISPKTAEPAITNKLIDLAYGRTDLNTALRQAEEEANKESQSAKK